MPVSLPSHAPYKQDPNSIEPGRQSFGVPEGDVFLGCEIGTMKQIWVDFKYFLRHQILMATTGGGKTETILAQIMNFLSAGVGVMLDDPKASPKPIHKLAYLAARYGRTDDLLFMNFTRPNKETLEKTTITTTNTFVPIQTETPEGISNLLISMMPKVKEGSNSGFAQNAIGLAKALSSCMCEYRDLGDEVSWDTFREKLTLANLLETTNDLRLSKETRKNLQRTLYSSVPGIDPHLPPDKQNEDANKQFGYISSYLAFPLMTLAEVYGNVFSGAFGDIDYTDVIRQQRILGNFIPALQIVEEDRQMIARIILSGKKRAMSLGLGDHFEGTTKSIKNTLPYQGGPPAYNAMDEYRYLGVKDMAIAFAQARELGISSLLGVQGIAGVINSVGKEEADEYWGNSDLKHIGRLKGGCGTFEKLKEGISEVDVLRAEGRTAEYSEFGNLRNKPTSSYQKSSPINIDDFTRQIEGEMHLFKDDRVIRYRSLFIESPYETGEVGQVIFNNFVDLPKPDLKELHEKEKARHRLLDFITEDNDFEHNSDSKAVEGIAFYLNSISGFEGIITAAVEGFEVDALESDDDNWLLNDEITSTTHEISEDLDEVPTDLKVIEEPTQQEPYQVEMIDVEEIRQRAKTNDEKLKQLDLLTQDVPQSTPYSIEEQPKPTDLEIEEDTTVSHDHSETEFDENIIFDTSDDEIKIAISELLLEIGASLTGDNKKLEKQLEETIRTIIDDYPIERYNSLSEQELKDELNTKLQQSIKSDTKPPKRGLEYLMSQKKKS